MTGVVLGACAAACLVAVCGALAAGLRIVKEYERGVVFRLGRVRRGLRGPGPTLVVPFVDRLVKVDLRAAPLPVSAKDALTRDGVSVRLDVVVHLRVVDPVRALTSVADYRHTVAHVTLAALRSVASRVALDELLAQRDDVGAAVQTTLAAAEDTWGVRAERVDVRDIALPEVMRAAMAREAEASREARARQIVADSELAAARTLVAAARELAAEPAALKLRVLETVQDAPLALPVALELLREPEPPAVPEPPADSAVAAAPSFSGNGHVRTLAAVRAAVRAAVADTAVDRAVDPAVDPDPVP